MSEQKGVWRTICGRKVFIAEGQTLREAMKASGKFTDHTAAARAKRNRRNNATVWASDGRKSSQRKHPTIQRYSRCDFLYVEALR